MSSDEQAIRDLVDLWHRATAAGDVDTVLGLMTDDVVFLVAGKPPIRGRSAFERGLRALLERNRIEPTGEVQEVDVSGNLAYCWTKLTVRVVPLADGKEMIRAGSALSILRKQSNGSWALTRDANLSAATS
ncbi:MAG: YybH family protein [Burkholderiales bacterium]